MTKTLQEIAEIVGGELQGDGSIEIFGVNNLSGATEKDIAFADEKHIDEARQSRAAALLLPRGTEEEEMGFPIIYVDDVRAAFAMLLKLFIPPICHENGVSDKAHIGKGVTIGENATVMGFAYIDDYAKIGDGVVVYPHTYIGQYSEIGEDTVIYSNVSVREHCKVGKRCLIHSSAVIGADGFGFTSSGSVHTKVPQVGNVVLEDDVEIGACDCIDRATIGSTIIGKGTKMDNSVHIGHNCHIGQGNIIVAQTGISGSTSTGENVTFGGQSGTVGHIEIGSNSVFAARSGVTGSTPEGVFYAGFPARPHQEWLRSEALIRRLPDLLKRIRLLEKELKELKGSE